MCFFNKLDLTVRLRLFLSYCSSIYGSELWSLDSDNIAIFCTAWRKALRRIFNLPYKFAFVPITIYQLSVTHFLFLMNCANDQRASLHRACSRLLVLSGQFPGTVLVMGSKIHHLVLMNYIVVIDLTGHMICSY